MDIDSEKLEETVLALLCVNSFQWVKPMISNSIRSATELRLEFFRSATVAISESQIVVPIHVH